MSEKELDKLFEAKLGQRAFDYNPQAWRAMEQMLDAKKRASVFYWRSAAAILAFFGLATVFALTQNSISTTSQEKPTNSIATQPSPTLQDDALAYPEKELNSQAENAEAKNSAQPSSVVSQEKVSVPANKVEPNENTPDLNSGQKDFTESIPSSAATGESKMAAVDFNKQEKETTLSSGARLEKSTLLALPALSFANTPFGLESDVLFIDNAELNQGTSNLANYPITFFVKGSFVSSTINFDQTGGYGFTAGVGAEKTLGNDFSASIGLNYIQRVNLGLVKTSDSLTYSFSAHEIRNERELFKTHHLELPIYFSYKLSTRQKISAGASVSYLLSSEIKVSREEKQQEVLVHKRSRTEITKADQNSIDFSLNGQYQYLFLPGVSAGVMVNYGLADFDLEIEGTQRLTDVRLFLQYSF